MEMKNALKNIDTVMTRLLGASWATTVLGAICAGVNLWMNGVTPKTAAASVLMTLFGIITKSVTAHSTVAQVEQASVDAVKK
jgi:multisubunit Na+/H+ antiporter MnhG subunit